MWKHFLIDRVYNRFYNNILFVFIAVGIPLFCYQLGPTTNRLLTKIGNVIPNILGSHTTRTTSRNEQDASSFLKREFSENISELFMRKTLSKWCTIRRNVAHTGTRFSVGTQRKNAKREERPKHSPQTTALALLLTVILFSARIDYEFKLRFIVSWI